MAVTEVITNQSSNESGEDLRAFAREYVDQLCSTSSRFLRWERQHILSKDPSPKAREDHRQTLKWLLRAARLVYSLAADPDFPDSSSKDALEAVIWQLEQSWKAIYQPMPEEEANRLLAEVFPDEPPT